MPPRNRIFAAALAVAFLWALNPGVGHAPPLAVAAAWLAAPTIAAAIARFVISVALSYAVNKLFGPKRPHQQRQASVMQLSLGEEDRVAIFGRSATGGQLLDAYNYGGKYGTDYEVLVIKVADHQCDALEGFLIGDTYYAFSAEGVQSGFGGQLQVYWMDGAPGQAAHSILLSTSALRLYGEAWTEDDRCASMAVFIAIYQADNPKAENPVWPQGRPSFKPVVRGKRCYDPRKDSTVAGGSGAHRWNDPTTWEWSENAAICDYNFDRGIYAEDQVGDAKMLLLGRGLSAEEAPPTRVFARANLCDEDVPLKAGGTEKRYRVGGVAFSGQQLRDVKEMFAEAMAGDIVKRDGGVEVLPGVAQSVVRTLTDEDFVVGESVNYEPFLPESERVNTVIPRYVEPSQLYASVTAPVRRSTADITADGGLKTAEVSLDLVTSQTQAQRICEIKRRLARKEQRLSRTLSPKHADLEDGDWVDVQSDRYFNGGTVAFRIDGYGLPQNWRNSIVCREIADTCYDWDPDVDEGVPGQAPVDEAGSLPAVELDNVEAVPIFKAGANGNGLPAIRFTWDAPPDPAILTIRAEVREVGGLEVAPTLIDHPESGLADVMNGVGPGQDLEVRLVPLGVPGRKFLASDWITITANDWTVAGVRQQLLAIADLNLWSFAAWEPVGGTVAVGVPPADPFTDFGDQLMAYEIPGGAPGIKLHQDGKTYGLKTRDGGKYAMSHDARTTDAGGSTIWMGFRSQADAPISDLADVSFPIAPGAVDTPCRWENIESDDPEFETAKFIIYDEPGDIAGGEIVTTTNHMLQGTRGIGTYVGPFRPNPDEGNLERYATMVAALEESTRQGRPGWLMAVRMDGAAFELVPPGPATTRDIP